MEKIAVSLSKGGTGKTTTAINLAYGLSCLKNKKVLLIDTDTQGQATFFLGAEKQAGLAELVLGDKKFEDVALNVRDNLDMIQGGRNIAAATSHIDNQKMRIEEKLAEVLKPAEDQYDFVIVDTAPGWDVMSINVMFYADYIIVPVLLEMASIRSLADFLQRIREVQEYREDLYIKYILPTFMDKRTSQGIEIIRELKGYFSEEKLCYPIRYNIALSRATGKKQSIFEYDSNSRGAEDYGRLVNKVLGET